ncbi:sortase family protein [Streptomyces albus]|uniref:Sortase family protein n=1 Tax=Streptomyces albus (strain ATCC 21838 / DSM 41398 / FERM P-419 / JCM 4703 / NBRC 107858) TaxID=1081613 RepID=A0A0B5EN30_STRA4|nr:sortase family protein [Streptomyces albus]AOU78266.1 sortase family protein [Streptomyces albus]AYN34018.1 class E sortase [Streptomyces albus]
MTEPVPERDREGSGSGAPPGERAAWEGSLADTGAFEAAVEQLDDPLNDPLPARHPSPWFRTPGPGEQPGPPAPEAQAGRGRRRKPPQPPETGQTPRRPAAERERPTGRRRAPQRAVPQPSPPAGPTPPSPARQMPPPSTRRTPPSAGQAPAPSAGRAPARDARQAAPPRRDDETVGLRVPPPEESGRARPVGDETVALRTAREAGSAAAAPEATGGRAARRKAAKRQGRGGSSGTGAAGAEAAGASGASGDGEESAAPLSRVEARRAARARKPSAGVIASRAVGEFFITLGVVLLLFVTYQLWWTNVRAHQQADGARNSLEEDWAKGKRQPGVFEPGQGFAIMHIPKLDVVVPIAEGISKHKVLDRGMVGHYGGEGTVKTAMPEDKTGNFAVAGHRNTHGEPFRYINRLKPGDPIVVETQHTYYVYKMANILPQTPPGNTSVIAPVPNGSGFTKPGRYLTLTTCTPEFTSTYRMIVWGKMVEERPRGKGKPDALLG